MKTTQYDKSKKDPQKIKGHARKIPSIAKAFQKEVRKNIATAVLSAFAFIVALVWRDAIKDIVDKIVNKFGITGTGYIYTIISALIITSICAAGIMFVSRWSEKK